MKRQFSLLFFSTAGVLTLATAAIAGISQATIVQGSSQAALTKANRPAVSQIKNRPGSALSKIEELDLTAEQKAEMEAIQANVAEQMSEVLTPEQMQALTEAQTDGGNMRSIIVELDRSQRSDFMTIMRAAQSDMMDILTLEQRIQIEGTSPRDRN